MARQCILTNQAESGFQRSKYLKDHSCSRHHFAVISSTYSEIKTRQKLREKEEAKKKKEEEKKS
jgi:hypothetical protein